MRESKGQAGMRDYIQSMYVDDSHELPDTVSGFAWLDSAIHAELEYEQVEERNSMRCTDGLD